MSDAKLRVAVNGYGVIGKRVADAVALQDDMVLVGVSDVVTDYRVRVAVERGYRVYAADIAVRDQMKEAAIRSLARSTTYSVRSTSLPTAPRNEWQPRTRTATRQLG